ncbi:MAG TPA: RidA family protein [Candidatus Angelobacter sp.]|nr:RidA family protein [Candidatus Angelobacter sp.]
MQSESHIRLFNPKELHTPMGYSHVGEVTSGKLVYIAGQVAHDVSNHLVGAGDLKVQVEQIFSNLKTALEAAGGTFQDVVKLNFYCVDGADVPQQLPAVREVRDRYVNTQNPPASTFVFVSRLVRPEWMIEVEAVAAVK